MRCSSRRAYSRCSSIGQSSAASTRSRRAVMRRNLAAAFESALCPPFLSGLRHCFYGPGAPPSPRSRAPRDGRTHRMAGLPPSNVTHLIAPRRGIRLACIVFPRPNKIYYLAADARARLARRRRRVPPRPRHHLPPHQDHLREERRQDEPTRRARRAERSVCSKSYSG